MEFRFGEAGRDAIGFVVQVPHYLSQAAYPTAALTLLGSVSTATGLDLPAPSCARPPTGPMRRSTSRSPSRPRSPSWSGPGAAVRRRPREPGTTAGLLAEGEDMPTADELAAQFEQFLAENQGRIDPPGPRSTDGPDS